MALPDSTTSLIILTTGRSERIATPAYTEAVLSLNLFPSRAIVLKVGTIQSV